MVTKTAEKNGTVDLLEVSESANVPAKKSPVVSKPRVIIDTPMLGEYVEELQKYSNLLLDLAGLGTGPRAVQWMADAIDAANRFCVDLRDQHPGAKLAPHTLFRAVKNATALGGLSFSKTLGQVYLVPFKNTALSKNGPDVYDCQLIVGYQGYEALAYSLDWLDSLFVECVLHEEIEADRFDYWHDENGPHIRHRPLLPRNVPRKMQEARNEIDAAYASWRTVRGSVGVAVADKGRIARAINDRSDMWRWDFPAGAKKTAIREAAKHWPKIKTLSSALFLDDLAEREQSQFDITGKRIAEFEQEPIDNGPAPGAVEGLGDDDADDSPIFRTLRDRIEKMTGGPQAVRRALGDALDMEQISDDQHARLLDQFEKRTEAPDAPEIPDDEVPY